LYSPGTPHKPAVRSTQRGHARTQCMHGSAQPTSRHFRWVNLRNGRSPEQSPTSACKSDTRHPRSPHARATNGEQTPAKELHPGKRGKQAHGKRVDCTQRRRAPKGIAATDDGAAAHTWAPWGGKRGTLLCTTLTSPQNRRATGASQHHRQLTHAVPCIQLTDARLACPTAAISAERGPSMRMNSARPR